jgi:Trk K+ transport system NAD-binding subunit
MLGSLPNGSVVVEGTVEHDAPVIASSLEDVLPRGTVVVAVQRGETMLLPPAGERLLPGDEVIVLARAADRERVRTLLGIKTGGG